MTRFASILGVATVATLVLLSGCEQAVTTDYTAKLDGTWTITGLTVTHPRAPTGIPTDVAVTIVDGSGVNTGTFTLTLTQTLIIPPATTPEMVPTVGSGTVTAESDSVLKVTLTTIMGPEVPQTVTDLEGSEQTVNYALSGEELTVSSPVFLALGVTTIEMPELKLTKEMASTSSR